MARKTSWQEKATAYSITKKLQRKSNPITSYAQLAEEYGAPVHIDKYGYSGPAASQNFREHVKRAVGRDKVFA